LGVVLVDGEDLWSVDGAVDLEKRDIVWFTSEPTGSSFPRRGVDEIGFGKFGQDTANEARTGVNTSSQFGGRNVPATKAEPGHDVDCDRELGVNCHNCYDESNRKKRKRNFYSP